MGEDWFGVVRWCNGDIAVKLEEMGILANDDNIQAVRCACENNHHFTDGMIEAWWAAIEEAVNNLKDVGELTE